MLSLFKRASTSMSVTSYM